MKGFRNLKVWAKSHQLTLEVYKLTQNFPREEQHGVTSQLRRAAASVPTNIAEGSGRKSEREFVQFLSIAMGSLNETDYLLELSKDLRFLENPHFEDLSRSIEELKSMLYVLIKNKSESLES